MEIEKELPSELSTCHEVILVQSVAINDQKKQIDLLKQEVAELNAAFKKLLAGNRREKYINPDQKLLEFPEDKELQAALEAAKREAEQEVEKITYTRTKQKKEAKPRTDSFPAHLRREETVKPLFDKDQPLADSGRKVVRQLIQEVLCYKKPELFVKAYYQEMLQEEQAVVTKEIIENLRAEIPAGLGEQGRFDASVAAAIACGKFELHIPYYRLQDMFAGSGWTPSRSTLDYTQDLLMEAVEELPKLMIRRVLQSRCIGMDDTGVTLIMPKEIPEVVQGDLRTQRLIEKMLQAKKEGKTSLDAKMWAYSGADDAPYDIFDFRVSRHRDGPSEFLTGYAGHVMADCYSGNLSVVLDKKSLMVQMACWSHARRKIFEAKDNDQAASALPLALIGQLYDIERRGSDLSNSERTELRKRESRLILDRLKSWLDGPIAKSLLPASKLGSAVQYVRNHWEALIVYVNDGGLPIDNNPVERLMKRIAIGRKNWLFVGSVRAGIRNASLMTLVSSAHRHDLDVQMYLEDIATHLNRGTAKPEDLLPDVWKQSHPEAIRSYRTEERRDKAELARLRTADRIAHA
jgi:transposase